MPSKKGTVKAHTRNVSLGLNLENLCLGGIIVVQILLISLSSELSAPILGLHGLIAFLLFIYRQQQIKRQYSIRHLKQNLEESEARNQTLKQELICADTALQVAEDETIQKSKFLADASHDLKQPLQSIGLLLYSLENKLIDPETKELVLSLERSHQSMNELFSALLDISKLDAKSVDVNRSLISLKDIFRSLSVELQPIADKKGLTLTFNDTAEYVSSDTILLTRIIRNLIHNALVHTDEGEVKISFHQTLKSISIHISDTGPGIPKDELENIFSEFYQLNSNNNGAGLGLSIVSRLCNLLGLDIAVDSTIGEGSTFKLTIARAQAPIKTTQTRSPLPQDKLSGLHVLLFEKDLSVVNTVQNLLKDWHCQVSISNNIADAYRQVSTDERIKVVIFDPSTLNTVSGTQFFQTLRQNSRTKLAGICTSQGKHSKLAKEYSILGAQVLPKPIQPAKLRNALNRSLSLI